MSLKSITWVIFDVDGTLYHQQLLRFLMTIDMLLYYLVRPWRYHEILWVMQFRKRREQWAGEAIDQLNDTQFSRFAKEIAVEPRLVRMVIEQWIYQRPLKFLTYCRFKSLSPLLNILALKGIKIGIISDYPCLDKLRVLNINADIVISATDEYINTLKPNPKPLSHLLNKMQLKPSQCIVIGDRQERDGLMAESCGVDFILLKNDCTYRELIQQWR